MKEAFHLSIQIFESVGGLNDGSPGAGRDAGPAARTELLFDPFCAILRHDGTNRTALRAQQTSLGHATRSVLDKRNHLVPWSEPPEEFSPVDLLIRIEGSQSQIILWEFLRESLPVTLSPKAQTVHF